MAEVCSYKKQTDINLLHFTKSGLYLAANDARNSITVKISKSQLTVKTFEQDGRLIDNFMIDKSNPRNRTTWLKELVVANCIRESIIFGLMDTRNATGRPSVHSFFSHGVCSKKEIIAVKN